MADLLLELFSEEIPARMQKDALAHLKTALATRLQKEGLGVEEKQFTGYVTPRRLAVIGENIPASQAAQEVELKGPRVGAPDAAIQGFLNNEKRPQGKRRRLRGHQAHAGEGNRRSAEDGD
jgi:glycyl-tRNA synthetase beta chain